MSNHSSPDSIGAPLLPERFWEKVLLSSTGCWVWTAARTHNGYGRFFRDGKQRAAHRVSYQAFGFDIPEGHQIDHLCRNRACVNPFHLEAVTPSVNHRRGLCGFDGLRNGKCRRGHDTRLPGGIYIVPATGDRSCVACKRENYRASRKAFLMAAGPEREVA